MLKAQDILNGLQNIVNEYSAIAIIWHIVFFIFIIALITKWQPSNRLLCILMCLPLLSVAILAWISGNPFNGILFSILCLLILVFGIKTSLQPVSTSGIFFVSAGLLMIFFGLVYPHFVEGSFFIYLIASPVGLLPCPTLSVLIGFILIFNGFGSQSIKLIFIVYGLFYGVFGVFKLGVYIDLLLLFGTLSLLVNYLRIR